MATDSTSGAEPDGDGSASATGSDSDSDSGDSDNALVNYAGDESDDGSASDSISAEPKNGTVFESVGAREFVNLTVKNSEDYDAYFALKDVESGETVLSYYVSSHSKVRVCAPAYQCNFEYVLGENWQNENAQSEGAQFANEQGAFRAKGVVLDFTGKKTYKYVIDSSDPNVTREEIDQSTV